MIVHMDILAATVKQVATEINVMVYFKPAELSRMIYYSRK